MINTTQKYFDLLHRRLDDNPRAVLISAFSLYAGINYDGADTSTWKEDYATHVRGFLSAITCKTNILVNMAKYKSCNKSRCVDCESNYIKQYLRLIATAEHYDKLSFKMTTSSYAKCVIFCYDKRGVCVLGRNLSDFETGDLVVQISDETVIDAVNGFAKAWCAATIINNDTVQTELLNNKISLSAFESLVGANF